MKPLTQAEIDALPEGTEIWVTWSGGNGPHRYRIHRLFDSPYAELPGGPGHRLDMCGEYPLTQVWLEEPSEKRSETK